MNETERKRYLQMQMAEMKLHQKLEEVEKEYSLDYFECIQIISGVLDGFAYLRGMKKD
jgi:hypothetical protein